MEALLPLVEAVGSGVLRLGRVMEGSGGVGEGEVLASPGWKNASISHNHNTIPSMMVIEISATAFPSPYTLPPERKQRIYLLLRHIKTMPGGELLRATHSHPTVG